MTEFIETTMPGIGTRYTTTTRCGRDIGVIVHQTGRRDVVIFDDADPDAAAASVELTEDEGRALSELLGGSRIVDRVEDLTHQVEGLVIDWVRVSESSEVAGQTLEAAQLRQRSGAAVVAIVRGDDTAVAPGGTDVLHAGATAVVVGSADGVETLRRLLQGSS